MLTGWRMSCCELGVWLSLIYADLACVEPRPSLRLSVRPSKNSRLWRVAFIIGDLDWGQFPSSASPSRPPVPLTYARRRQPRYAVRAGPDCPSSARPSRRLPSVVLLPAAAGVSLEIIYGRLRDDAVCCVLGQVFFQCGGGRCGEGPSVSPVGGAAWRCTAAPTPACVPEKVRFLVTLAVVYIHDNTYIIAVTCIAVWSTCHTSL